MSLPGITFKVSDKKPEIFNLKRKLGGTPTTPADLIKATWQATTRNNNGMTGKLQYSKCKELLQSSLPQDPNEMNQFVPRKNGFVDTVMMAYNQRHNLVIRPDDIWIAILSQLNTYVNAHTEELSNFFVVQEGKRRLDSLEYVGSRWRLDYRDLVNDFTVLLKKNINDPTLSDLILPDFSTTTSHDTATCAIVMMSILKSYFVYGMRTGCGIPEITLLGTKADYENILDRVRRLSNLEMGAEPRAFAALLEPIVRQFIAVFDAVTNNSTDPNIDMDFWSKMCHEQSFGTSENMISGWITAFCVWSGPNAEWNGPNVDTLTYNQAYSYQDHDDEEGGEKRFILDGMEYPRIRVDSIPSALCEAEVDVNDNGRKLKCTVVAGHVATRAVTSTTIAPAPAWFMFEKEDVEYEPPAWVKNVKIETVCILKRPSL